MLLFFLTKQNGAFLSTRKPAVMIAKIGTMDMLACECKRRRKESARAGNFQRDCDRIPTGERAHASLSPVEAVDTYAKLREL
jgi:hypothetical protein